MGRINPEEVQIEIDGIQFYQNEKYGGMKILWSGNIGFGEYDIYSKDADKESMYDDERIQEYMYTKWNGQSEYMDSQDNKWFIKLLLEKFIEKMEITG